MSRPLRSRLARALAPALLASLAACGGSGDPDSTPDPTPTPTLVSRLFALLASTHDPLPPNPTTEIEIVDLATFTKVGGFTLPGVLGVSLAVSPDGTRLYIADRKGGQILVRTPTGTDLGSIPFTGIADLLLNPAGTSLWAGTIQPPALARFDALTLAAGPSITPGGFAGGLALSPDGTKLAWTSFTGYGHATTGAYLADPTTLASPVAVPFTGSACNTLPHEVAFVGNSRLVVWDNNCDRIHQIDATTNTYLGNASDVAFTPDGASSVNYNNVLAASPTLQRVYGFKETGGAWRIDPFGLTSSFPAGFTGSARLVVLDVAEANLFAFAQGAPISLDRMATAGETVTPDVYTFVSSLAVPLDAVIRNVAP